MLPIPCHRSPGKSAQHAIVERILDHYGDNQKEYLDFVLNHYVTDGVGELDQDKLPELIKAKYHTVVDATEMLGSVADIWEVFFGFQKYLFDKERVS